MSSADKYRGAVVEDLQLPPAFCLPEGAPTTVALEAAYEKEFDYLPVLNDKRKPIGYLDVKGLISKFETGIAKDDDPVRKHTTLFPPFHPSTPSSSSTIRPSSQSQSLRYQVIHPLTPLSDLEGFLTRQEGHFALVTDRERKWVLGVATVADLETFVKRRGGTLDQIGGGRSS